MPTKSLLINFNDCPASIDSLLPDNGLANLAGSLMRAGHKTLILDYSTIEALRDYRTKEIQRKLKYAFIRYKIETAIMKKMSKATHKAFGDAEVLIQRCREKKILLIISEVRSKIADGLDFIGFKLWSGEGFIGSIKIAEAIKKEFPSIKIFAGGPQVDVFGEHILNYTDVFEALCVGEGEEVIVQLAEYAQNKRAIEEVDSLLYKRDGRTCSTEIRPIKDMDSIAEPSYDTNIYPAMEGDQKVKLVMLEESRGCPYKCNFCIHKVKSGNKWRIRKLENVLASIKRLTESIPTIALRFSGSNTPYFFRKELAQAFIDRNIKIKYVGFADTRQPEKEDYKLLKKSGCISLFFGVESADDYLLKEIIDKNSDAAWVRESLTKAKEAGILVAASIIIPCPGQTEESVKKTIDIMIETKPDGVSVCPGIPYPKTRWFQEYEKFGYEFPENVEEKMMTYSIKYTAPPPLLAPFPFKMDGKDFYAIIDEMLSASSKLERHGITTSLNDSQLMLAHVLGMSPKQIKDLNQKGMTLGQYERIKKAIRRFNDLVRA
ncbi:radical SAM protein [Candidatus Omnitrophota bacterium]